MTKIRTKKVKHFVPNYLVIDLIEKKGYIITDKAAITKITNISTYILNDRLKEGVYWEGRYVICVKPEVVKSLRSNPDVLRKTALV